MINIYCESFAVYLKWKIEKKNNNKSFGNLARENRGFYYQRFYRLYKYGETKTILQFMVIKTCSLQLVRFNVYSVYTSNRNFKRRCGYHLGSTFI